MIRIIHSLNVDPKLLITLHTGKCYMATRYGNDGIPYCDPDTDYEAFSNEAFSKLPESTDAEIKAFLASEAKRLAGRDSRPTDAVRALAVGASTTLYAYKLTNQVTALVYRVSRLSEPERRFTCERVAGGVKVTRLPDPMDDLLK